MSALFLLLGALTTPARADLEAAEAAVVRVVCERGGQVVGHGTGFVVEPTHLLTNHHVIEGCAAVFVVRSDDEKLRARVKESSASLDLAVVEVAQPLPLVLPFRAEAAAKGEEVFVLGFPGFAEFEQGAGAVKITKGVVSDVTHDPTGREVLQTDAAINPGNSGGPVLDSCGRVLGVATFKRAVSGRGVPEGIAWAVTAGEARAYVRSVGVDTESAAGSCDGPLFGAAVLLPLGMGLTSVFAVLVGLAGLLVALFRPARLQVVESFTRSGRHRPSPPPQPVQQERFAVCFDAGPHVGQRIVVGDLLVLGRDPAIANLVVPPDTPGVSKHHAEVRVVGGEVELKDCWSSAGVEVDDRTLDPGEWRSLRIGAVVSLGPAVRFHVERA